MRAGPVLLLGLLVGCATADPGAAPVTPSGGATSPVSAATGMPVELLGPVEGLPSCGPAPAGVDEEVPGLYLPAQARILEVTTDDPLTEVTGYLTMTPVQLRAWFQSQDELEIIHIEDEVRESEALLYDGTYRLFVQALAVCDLGSRFTAIVAPGADAESVPTPTGAAG